MAKTVSEDARWVLFGTALLLAAAVIHAGATAAGSEEAIRLVIRQTARISLLLFCAAFAASSLLRLWPAGWSRWMMRHRRWLGLSFALSHAVHLAAIVRLSAVAPDFAIETLTLIFGGLAYVFIALMAATSFDGAVGYLGSRNWQRLHRTGAYYIWFIFVQSYIPRAVDAAVYVPPTALLAGVLVLRIAAGRRARRRD